MSYAAIPLERRVAITTSLYKLDHDFNNQDYSAASTPYVTSQKIGTAVRELFRFSTLSHGTSVNSELKIGIRDVKLSSEVSDPNGYGQFTVEVRRVNTSNIPNTPYASGDTDQTPDIVETFLNVNLDPDSPNYIGKRIGDRFITISDNGDININGDYPNQSKYIRVDLKDGVKNKTNEKTLVPFGFAELFCPIPNVSSSVNLRASQAVTSQVANSVYNSNVYFGFQSNSFVSLDESPFKFSNSSGLKCFSSTIT